MLTFQQTMVTWLISWQSSQTWFYNFWGPPTIKDMFTVAIHNSIFNCGPALVWRANICCFSGCFPAHCQHPLAHSPILEVLPRISYTTILLSYSSRPRLPPRWLLLVKFQIGPNSASFWLTLSYPGGAPASSSLFLGPASYSAFVLILLLSTP